MKKTTRLLVVLVALVMVLTVVFAACEKAHICGHKCPECNKCTDLECNDPACADKCPGHKGPGPDDEPEQTGTMADLADYRAYMKAELADIKNIVIGQIDATIDAKVATAYDAGVAAIDGAKTVAKISAAFNNAKVAMAECVPLADGMYNFSGRSSADKTKILAVLEAFAIRAGLTGTTLFENGGYVMYSNRITLGTENYIPGYGFGTLAEGSINADMETESTAAWKRYYHTVNASDPGFMNYLNDKGSETGDFYGYMGASFYTTFMNATKDGYDWVPELAAADVESVGKLDENGQSATWRIQLRDDLKYNTLSEKSDRAAFNNRAVELEDFLTPFKLLLNQGNGYYRGAEMANATGAQVIKGAKAYYNATAGKAKGILSDDEINFSKTVGISVKEEDGKWYFYFELGVPVTPFYAMYYISSSMYMPIPAEFIELVGVDNYLGFNSDKSMSPVDNSLSLGAYTVERWDTDQQIVYKKNPNYVYAETKYSIEGIHINILKAMASDTEASFKEFMSDKTDSAGIPDTKLKEYQSDPRTRKTTGDSCFKLNMNALNKEDWLKFFGEDGEVAITPANNYWNVEPAMSNAHFRSALSYALNRNDLADIKGSVSSVNFFSSNYMSDPVKGIAYDATKEHETAIANLLRDTDDGGFSLELARDYFRMAIDELEASGAYTRGTKANPTVISLEVAWMYPAHNEAYHKYVKQYWEDAFNNDPVLSEGYKLEVNFWVGTMWSDVYYNKMMLGQFDIAFGSISGNTLDPLNFMSVLSSNQALSGSFTLNWALNTNDPTADLLVFEGKRWSYDALYSASQEETSVTNGMITSEVLDITKGYSIVDEGDKTVFTYILRAADGVVIDEENFDIVLYSYGDARYFDYDEVSIMEYLRGGAPVKSGNKITYTFDIPAEVIAQLPAGDTQGMDIYLGYTDADGKYHAPADEKGYPSEGLNVAFKSDVLLYGYSIAREEAVDENGKPILDEDYKPTYTENFIATIQLDVKSSVTLGDVVFTLFGFDGRAMETYDLSECLMGDPEVKYGSLWIYKLKLTPDTLAQLTKFGYQGIEVDLSYTKGDQKVEDYYVGMYTMGGRLLVNGPVLDNVNSGIAPEAEEVEGELDPTGSGNAVATIVINALDATIDGIKLEIVAMSNDEDVAPVVIDISDLLGNPVVSGTYYIYTVVIPREKLASIAVENLDIQGIRVSLDFTTSVGGEIEGRVLGYVWGELIPLPEVVMDECSIEPETAKNEDGEDEPTGNVAVTLVFDVKNAEVTELHLNMIASDEDDEDVQRIGLDELLTEEPTVNGSLVTVKFVISAEKLAELTKFDNQGIEVVVSYTTIAGQEVEDLSVVIECVLLEAPAAAE